MSCERCAKLQADFDKACEALARARLDQEWCLVRHGGPNVPLHRFAFLTHEMGVDERVHVAEKQRDAAIKQAQENAQQLSIALAALGRLSLGAP